MRPIGTSLQDIIAIIHYVSLSEDYSIWLNNLQGDYLFLSFFLPHIYFYAALTRFVIGFNKRR